MNTNQPTNPPNAAVVVDRFQNKRRQLPRTPSPIAADNWKQAIQILAQVVENQDAEEVQQLRRTISHLSAHTQLVQLENEGLRNVIRELKPSKNKRRRLDLQHDEEFYSAAVLWSPHKIRQAEDRYEANKEQELQKKVDKAHQKEVQTQKKLQDQPDKQQRRVERERVREEKARKKAANDAEKQRKKQERDAAKSIQLPQTGKRKASSKPSTEPAAKKQRARGAARVVVEASPSPAPPPVTTRSGRKTKPNKKWEQVKHRRV